MESNIDKYILIVEDSSDLRALLREFFEGEGFNIRLASNGQEALDLLKTTKTLPSFILLDLMMPIMDGYTFREEQRRDQRFSSIPVVVMTADGQGEEKTKNLGVKGFLKKPINDVDDLIKTAMKFCF